MKLAICDDSKINCIIIAQMLERYVTPEEEKGSLRSLWKCLGSCGKPSLWHI